jgi:hypothetical protein
MRAWRICSPRPACSSSGVVLVVGGDVADPSMEPGPVVLQSHPCQLGVEHGGVAQALEVGPLGLDVAEQRLDPGLIGGRAGSSQALGDSQAGQELSGRVRGHLAPLSEQANRMGRAGSSASKSVRQMMLLACRCR